MIFVSFIKDETVTLEEIEELKTYIETELEFLKKCGEFFENASDLSEPGTKEDSVNQYQELIVSIVKFLIFYLIFTYIYTVFEHRLSIFEKLGVKFYDPFL